jgi:hypothetical protein
MSEHKCINCNTIIEVYYYPNGFTLYDTRQADPNGFTPAGLPSSPGEILSQTSTDDEYICENCLVKEYMQHV